MASPVSDIHIDLSSVNEMKSLSEPSESDQEGTHERCFITGCICNTRVKDIIKLLSTR